jgi:hypothetical protein
MQLAQTARWISEARFSPYLDEFGGDHAAALELYLWNARISAAAFETLHHVEVLLRNAVDAQFPPMNASAYPTETWLLDPGILNSKSQRHVRATVRRLSRERKTATRGRVVAGLSFGFWRSLFDRTYSGLWVAQLHRAFPCGSGNRAEIAALMSNLLPFRNRLAHHETIVRRPVDKHYEEMLVLAGLIDPDAKAWIERWSLVTETLLEDPRRASPARGGR